jgi:hypothetical protein
MAYPAYAWDEFAPRFSQWDVENRLRLAESPGIVPAIPVTPSAAVSQPATPKIPDALPGSLMLTWTSFPTFGAMLLFWLLGAYVLTRSPRSAVSWTAVAAQIATGCYLLGQGMQANAQTLEQWLPWARNLQWGAAVAPTCWYWLTVLLLREQQGERTRRYVDRIAIPLGAVFATASVVFAIGIYVDDLMYRWSAVSTGRFHVEPGLIYPAFVLLLAATTILGALNVYLGWLASEGSERRPRFAWLLLSAALFIVAANSLGITELAGLSEWPTWVGHLLLAAAMAVMAWNVSAYSLLLQGSVIKRDFLYFVTGTLVVMALYAPLFWLARMPYTFELVGLVVGLLTLAVFTHALIDVGRGLLDRFFFADDVQHLRANLATVIQNAALAEDLGPVLSEARTEIDEISSEHFVRLCERALRRLNNPASLAESGLAPELPRTFTARRAQEGADPASPATPLELSRATREILMEAIERLKPPDGDVGPESPAALQYHILREEYLLGHLNKQIMTRHALSEGTFHRNRRQAIRTLAQELLSQEGRLAGAKSGTF